LDARLKAIARRQHAVLTRQQALQVLTAQQLRTALYRGDLEIRQPGVYGVGGTPKSWRSNVMAAVLAVGKGAVASHRSAAALWALTGFPPGPVEITIDHQLHHRPGVHRTRSLEPIDVTTIDRIPVTRVARTLIDLAATTSPTRLEDAVDDALCRRLVTFNRLMARNAALAVQGRPNLGPVLDAWLAPGRIPDSVAEMRLVRRMLAYGLPQPERQVEIPGIGRVDLFYREPKVVIELTSFRWHFPRRAHELTNRRLNLLTGQKFAVFQPTLDDLKGDGRAFCKEVAALVQPRPEE
jgi:hypothetical protein